MTPPAPAPVCPYGVLPEDHNSNPCAVKPAPAPKGSRDCHAGDPECEAIIEELQREVAALQAWKAEAQQRGAEMARRGLELSAERDALREALEEYAGRAELQAIWHSCRACERDATIARAALKGDGRR